MFSKETKKRVVETPPTNEQYVESEVAGKVPIGKFPYYVGINI